MVVNAIKEVAIRTAVRMVAEGIRDNPRKNLSRLAGLLGKVGVNKGHFAPLLARQLEDPRSPYARLVRRLARQVDIDALCTLGENFGVYVFGESAAALKKLPAPLPWCLALEPGEGLWEDIPRIVAEGRALGIYCYWITAPGGGWLGHEGLLDALAAETHCTFALGLGAEAVSEGLCRRLTGMANALPFLELGGAAGPEAKAAAARRLLATRRICGAFAALGAGDGPSEALLAETAELGLPVFAALRPPVGQVLEEDAAHEAWSDGRDEPAVPVLALDVHADVAHMGELYFGGALSGGVRPDGSVLLANWAAGRCAQAGPAGGVTAALREAAGQLAK